MHFWTFYTVWVLHCRTKARKKRRWGYYFVGFFNLSAKNVFLSVAFASYSVVAKTVMVGRALVGSCFQIAPVRENLLPNFVTSVFLWLLRWNMELNCSARDTRRKKRSVFPRTLFAWEREERKKWWHFFCIWASAVTETLSSSPAVTGTGKSRRNRRKKFKIFSVPKSFFFVCF